MNQTLDTDAHILIVDDEEHFLNSLYLNLRSMGIKNVTRCYDSQKVLSMVKKGTFSLVLLDILMPGIGGDELLPQILQECPGIQVIMVTASAETELAQSCLKNGAFDYLVKPYRTYQLMNSIQNALRLESAFNENARLKESVLSETPSNREYFKSIVTSNPKMLSIFKYIEAVGRFSKPVLITGETGTGKELIARAIHNASGRTGDFVADNVAGWDETLFSDTLYGHEKGSFTSAVSKRKGLLEQAKDGTLFLDEIGDLALPLQTKLLRLLQEKEYYPLGSDQVQIANTRFVLATNRDLNAMKDKGTFRRDLFFRLNTHHIHLPALRERREDIPLLVEHFIKKAAAEFDKTEPHLPDELIAILYNYNFTGNIRELESMIEDAMSRHQSGPLSLDVFMKKITQMGGEVDLSEPVSPGNPGSAGEPGVIFGRTLPTFKQMVKLYTGEILKRANDNQTAAARMAGLARTTFIRYWKNQY